MGGRTPGEWEVGIHREHVEFRQCICVGSQSAPAAPGKIKVVAICGETQGDLVPQSLADAHLIAAAPDLLAACKEALAMIQRQDDFNDDGDGEMMDRLAAAIAKAQA